MADFPDSIYAPRTMVNRPGATYDAAKTKKIYAEDFNLDRDEIVAIETILGLNPEGTHTSVVDRLEYIESELGGGGDPLDAYPVGALYLSVVSTSPATLFGGTWSAFGQGKVLVGIDSSDTDFDTVEETRGEKAHTLSAAESGVPAHGHTQDGHNHDDSPLVYLQGTGSGLPSRRIVGVATTGATLKAISTEAPTINNNAAAAAANAHNNLQPSIVVYMWKRTA